MPISKINNKSLEDGAVIADDIAPGTITNAKISPSAAIANAKLANSSITVNCSQVSLGGSTTINTAIDWQAVTVADGSTTVNTEAGKGYFLDTNAGIIEAFLPSSPTRGDRVVLADYSGTFATNQAIVNTGGALLDSTAGNDFKLTTNNTIAEFIYVDAAKGWLVYLNQAAGTTPSGVMNAFGGYDTLPPSYPYIGATGGTVTTDGDYKIHTFTGDGSFVVTYNGLGTACAPSNVDYLVVAGGGSGRGGGGGAGGYRTTYPTPGGGFPISTTTYPITVGAGTPQNGSDSIFSTITSTGGGRGGLFTTGFGNPGGSGGGGSEAPGLPVSGGTGNTPPVSPPQGNPGGDGAPPFRSGGGGGANAAGGTSPSYPIAGNGGAGKCNAITGTNLRYADGGGGTNQNDANQPGAGGLAGGPTGGRGAYSGQSGGENAPENRGGGGGGSWCSPPGLGGKGVVIIRYKYQ